MKPQSLLFRTLPEYLGLQLFRFAYCALPTRMALDMGEIIGSIAGHIQGKRRRIAERNIRSAFPHLSRKAATAMAFQVFRHFSRALAEFIRAGRMLRPSNFKQFVTVENEARMNRLFASHQGAIWVSGHFGVWELFGMYARMRNAHFTSVYRPMKNAWIDAMLLSHRTAFGQHLADRKGALKTLLRALRRERSHVGILVDQHVRHGGIWVPFFDRPAATTPAPAVLALRTGAPIVIWHTLRLPGCFRFKLSCEKPIFVTASGDRAAVIRNVTTEISRRIEAFIRKTPEQWNWPHRRWRIPPPQITERRPENHEEPVKIS